MNITEVFENRMLRCDRFKKIVGTGLKTCPMERSSIISSAFGEMDGDVEVSPYDYGSI